MVYKDDVAFKQRQKEEQKALKEAQEKAAKGGPGKQINYVLINLYCL